MALIKEERERERGERGWNGMVNRPNKHKNMSMMMMMMKVGNGKGKGTAHHTI